MSLNAHIFVICKDNFFKFSVIVHNSSVFLSFSVNILLLTFIAKRSLLSDLRSNIYVRIYHLYVRMFQFYVRIIRM